MVLEEAVKRTDFARKRKEWQGTNKSIGLSLFYHGAGFTGAGERNLKSKARLDLTPTGVRIAVGSTEIGQGTRTMHAQIVTDALGIPYESVEVAQPDTSRVADSGPTVASRTCMVVGKILEECAQEMKEKLGGLTPEQYYARNGAISVERMYEPPDWIQWNDNTYRGDAYATFGWGCDVAELELDPLHSSSPREPDDRPVVSRTSSTLRFPSVTHVFFAIVNDLDRLLRLQCEKHSVAGDH